MNFNEMRCHQFNDFSSSMGSLVIPSQPQSYPIRHDSENTMPIDITDWQMNLCNMRPDFSSGIATNLYVHPQHSDFTSIANLSSNSFSDNLTFINDLNTLSLQNGHQYIPHTCSTSYFTPASYDLSATSNPNESEDTTTSASTLSPNSNVKSPKHLNTTISPGVLRVNDSEFVISQYQTNFLESNECPKLLSNNENIKLNESKELTRRRGRGRQPNSKINRPKKPEETYIVMIDDAINAHEGQRATLSQIYEYLCKKYPDFYCAGYKGWKNSIRHNLSLNQRFVKQPKKAHNNKAGKGHYWSIDTNIPLEKRQNVNFDDLKTPYINSKRKPRSHSNSQQKILPKFVNLHGLHQTNHHETEQSFFDQYPPADSSQVDLQVPTWEQSSFCITSNYNANHFNYPMIGAFQSPDIWNTTNNASGLLIPATSSAFDPCIFYDQKPQVDMMKSEFSNGMHSQTNAEIGSCLLNGEPIKVEKGIPNIDSIYGSTSSRDFPHLSTPTPEQSYSNSHISYPYNFISAEHFAEDETEQPKYELEERHLDKEINQQPY